MRLANASEFQGESVEDFILMKTEYWSDAYDCVKSLIFRTIKLFEGLSIYLAFSTINRWEREQSK